MLYDLCMVSERRPYTVAELLGDKNLTRVAEQIGVSKTLLSRVRSGTRRLTDETRAKLAGYFNLADEDVAA